MADVTQAPSRQRAANPQKSRDTAATELTQATADAVGSRSDDETTYAELLFFAYRDFVSEPDEILATYNFGRAHHRVLHFVHQHPDLRVAELLSILKITKQSLSRVLKQLIDEGFVIQRAGQSDGRERHLFVTKKGAKLAEQLAGLQLERIKNALQEAGPDASRIISRFLFAMIRENEQPHVAKLISKLRDELSFEHDTEHE